MKVTKFQYLKALEIVEAYHLQIGLPEALKNRDPEMAKPYNVRAGTVLVCERPYKANTNLTQGKEYTVVRTHTKYNGDTLFYIYDDNGKLKSYGNQNTQFDVK